MRPSSSGSGAAGWASSRARRSGREPARREGDAVRRVGEEGGRGLGPARGRSRRRPRLRTWAAARRPGASLPARPPRPLAPYLPAGRRAAAARWPRRCRGPGPLFTWSFNEELKKFFPSPPATASRWRRWRPYHVTGGLGSGDRRVDAAAAPPPPPRRCHGDERGPCRGGAPPRPCWVPQGRSPQAPGPAGAASVLACLTAAGTSPPRWLRPEGEVEPCGGAGVLLMALSTERCHRPPARAVLV